MTENTQSEFDSYLVILIDANTARFFAVRLGVAEEIADVENHVLPATGDIVKKTSHRHDTYLYQHANSVIARAEVLWREQDFDWLMIGGTEEALGELYDQLPRALHERLAVGLHLSPKTETAKILEDKHVNFLIIGGGQMESEVRAEISRLNPKNLQWINEYLPNDEIRRRILECHVSLGQFDRPQPALSIARA